MKIRKNDLVGDGVIVATALGKHKVELSRTAVFFLVF